MAVDQQASREKAEAIFAGRIDILYALGRHYLSLPFAVLCLPATFMAPNPPGFLPLVPLLLQIAIVIAAERLTTAYHNREPGSDPHFWAWRYTFLSGIAGAVWGLGACLWFVPDSFPAQAYLVLAFLGMTAAEFIARSAHRPAFISHCCASLGPLIAMLLWRGGLYATLAAILVAFFAAVLVGYCDGMARLLDESIRLRNENAALVARLSREKSQAMVERDAAEASTLVKGAFIANMSHELRTPLNALLGMAQLLDRAGLPRRQADHVKVMLEAGSGLQTLIDDVIALTRDESASHEDDCDAAMAARAVVRLLQSRAWEKRLRLTLSVAPNLPRVAADPRRVRQALLKLADNALKFTERGLVDIHADVVEAKGQAWVRFTVSDTGPGIAPDAAARLFDPFTPGDVSYTRRQQGAGLGLAVAKRIIQQAGGEIGFESRPGEGSHFFFSLPVSQRVAEEPLAPADEARQPPPTGLTLLVHLQTADAASTFARLLEPFGNKLVIAASLADAVDRGSRQNFDAIIIGAADADSLAAAPGVQAPLIAVLLRGDRTPSATGMVLRWPVEADPLYSALDAVCVKPEEDTQDQKDSAPALDIGAIAALEQSVGGSKALVEILQCYIGASEDLMSALNTACNEEKWDEAARVAQDIMGAAGGLGLSALTQAARSFAKSVREAPDRHGARNAAQILWSEHLRARQALRRLYPDTAA